MYFKTRDSRTSNVCLMRSQEFCHETEFKVAGITKIVGSVKPPTRVWVALEHTCEALLRTAARASNSPPETGYLPLVRRRMCRHGCLYSSHVVSHVTELDRPCWYSYGLVVSFCSRSPASVFPLSTSPQTVANLGISHHVLSAVTPGRGIS